MRDAIVGRPGRVSCIAPRRGVDLARHQARNGHPRPLRRRLSPIEEGVRLVAHVDELEYSLPRTGQRRLGGGVAWERLA